MSPSSSSHWTFTPYLFPTVFFANETIIITGGNIGVGLATATHCLKLGAAHVIITSRDAVKGEDAVKEIRKAAGHNVAGVVEVWELDLTERKSIEAFVGRAAQLERIDRVLMNAGLAPVSFTTVNGIESTIAVSVYGTFLLLVLLMPLLRKSGAASGRTPLVSVVSSDMHRYTKFPERNNESILAVLNEKEKARMLDRYSVAKLIQIMLTLHLGDMLVKQSANGKPDVILGCCCPGLVDTGLQRYLGFAGRIMKFLMHAYNPEVGSRDVVNAVGAGEEAHGRFMVYCEYVPIAELATSQEGKDIARKLWSELARSLNVPDDKI